MSWLIIVLGIIGLTVLIFLVWRLVSHRRELPCPVWLHWMVEMDNPFTRTNRAAVIIEHLDLKPGMKALDFGCGPGRVTIPMAERVERAGPGDSGRSPARYASTSTGKSACQVS